MLRYSLVALLPAVAIAQAPKLLTKTPNPYSAARNEVNAGFVASIPVLQNPPEINNHADLSDWAGAYKVENAMMPLTPVDQGAPVMRVDVYIAWGKDGLYIATEAFTNPKDIVTSRQGRDMDQTGHDQVYIQVDTQGTGNNAVVMAVNPSNVQYDALTVEGGKTDASYDMIWKSGTAVTPTGWISKVMLPFSSVRRSPGKWALQIGYTAVRKGVTYNIYYPQNYNDVVCNICQSIQLANAPIKNDSSVLMVAPRIYQERVGNLNDNTMHDPKVTNKNGLDVRYQTTNYVLEGTYKPDFATIESDVNPLYINNRFKYQYADKRPFFMNGMDVFGDFSASSLTILSTRSIIDPEYGVKGSGQAGRFSWNVMQAKDLHGGDSISSDGIADVAGRQTSDIAMGSTWSYGSGSTTGKVSVVGTDREVLGGAVTGANGSFDGYSRSGGVSVFQSLNNNWNLTAQAVGSSAALPGADGNDVPKTGSGTSLGFNAKYTSFYCSGFSTTISPKLRLDMGFIGLGGIKEDFVYGGWIFRNSNALWQTQNIQLAYDNIRNWDGTPAIETGTLGYTITFKGPTVFQITRSINNREWWMGQGFDKAQTALSLTYYLPSTWWMNGSAAFSYVDLKGIDYARVAQDHEKSFGSAIIINLASVRLNLKYYDRYIYDYSTGDLNTRATRLYLYAEQVLPFDLFWRVQYQPIRYIYPAATNPGYPTDTYWNKSVQYLVGWRPNPFSGCYVGYNAVRRTTPTVLDPRNEPITDKGMFFKATYAFQF